MTYSLWKLDDHPELVSALFAAHREAAIGNDNASKIAVQQAWGGSGRFENAMIAGLATIGALHAPLTAARDLWEDSDPVSRMQEMLGARQRYPGFGNSFWAGTDPAFKQVDDVLRDGGYEGRYSPWSIQMIGMCDYVKGVHAWGRLHFPNAAMYTAIVASICEVPRGLESALFALARIPAWAEMCGAVQHPVVGGVR